MIFGLQNSTVILAETSGNIEEFLTLVCLLFDPFDIFK